VRDVAFRGDQQPVLAILRRPDGKGGWIQGWLR
jgi:hypothetical protein